MIKKKVLVTGGAGFLGSHLCDRLLKGGNEVVCLDNYFTGQKQNILHLLENPFFELIRHDVTMPFLLKLMRSITWHVRHLPSITSIMRSKPLRHQ